MTAPAAPDIPAALRAWLAARGLTPRQHEVACAFYRLSEANGYAPTLAELGDALGISKVVTYGHGIELERKGVLARTSHRHAQRNLYLRWQPPARDWAAECKVLRKALKHYGEQAVGGEVARDALEATND
jgi:DNA-binding MarR family transcriptional regulator